MNDSAILREFTEIFGAGGGLHIVRAPGRVNLIGEHTDYNDGFVFPMAIEPEVRIVCRSRGDQQVKLASTMFPKDVVEFSLQAKIERGEPSWANYPRGVAAGLLGAGIPLPGIDILFSNTLPVGGGLSSSAAMEVGTARAFLKIAGLEMDNNRLALICQKAEHEYALVPCGIMDQMIVASGQADHAMLMDCRDLSKQFIPIDANEVVVVIVNSMVKHELTGGEYAERRGQCEAGVKFFQALDPHVKALRDVTLEQITTAHGTLDDVIWRRCHHVITENKRATDFADKLVAHFYEEAGELMVQSHESLGHDYEVSCDELDFLSAEAMKVKGVYGARMTGGGFGGSIVALVQPRAVESLTKHLRETYLARFGITPDIFATKATQGASVVL